MKTLKTILLPFLTIIAVVLALNTITHGPKLPEATAQSVAGLPFPGSSSGTGAGNPWDGKGEMIQTWTGTLSASVPAVICTSVAVGGQATRVSVKTFTITCTTAQYVNLLDGDGTTTLAYIYCPALTPQYVERDALGTGLTTTLGSSLKIQGGSTGTCAILYAVQRPTN